MRHTITACSVSELVGSPSAYHSMKLQSFWCVPLLLAKCAFAEHAIEGGAQAEEICPNGRCPMRPTIRSTITVFCTNTVTTTATSTVCLTVTNTKTTTCVTTVTTCPTPSTTQTGCGAMPTGSPGDDTDTSDPSTGTEAIGGLEGETEGEQRPWRTRVCVRRIGAICTRWRWITQRRFTSRRRRFPHHRSFSH